ncbi:TPA: replication initiation protein [Escherichia coli]|jgi:plasmid replication initiation protein|uniref:replication initiation protein RepM n=1 Tax=Acinetobacter lwoffii TaxID=28090 RepID=UPI0013DE9D50|nr:replication initiation protein RepM [Acinetobacter lwoffii]NGP43196.1 replication initiation protein [Acinetobacter lwoffii]HDS1852190.1 replication initiation protein [Escherichia coli]
MSKDSRLVVKDNSLIDASFNLSLVEQRLMLLAIVEAREIDKLTPETPIEVKAIAYRDQYKTDESNAYSQLADATKQLFNRQFSYIDRYADTDAVTVSRWVNEVTYVNDKGMVVMYLNRNVISMISRLEANFTQYLLEQVSEFKSKYSIRLYELLIKYRDIGTSKKFEIAELRSKLGLEDNEYKLNAVFKRDVLDKAVKEINDKADIQIKYEQFKEGRKVSHILFKFIKKKETKQKKSKDQNTVDMFNGMTIKQIMMFSDKLSRDTAFQNHYTAHVGELEREYAIRIGEELAKPERVLEWMPYLKAVGYVPNKK